MKTTNSIPFISATSLPSFNRFENGEMVIVQDVFDLKEEAFYLGINPWGYHVVIVSGESEYRDVANCNIFKTK